MAGSTNILKNNINASKCAEHIFLNNQNINEIVNLCNLKVTIYENTKINNDVRNIIINFCKKYNIVIDKNISFNSYTLYSVNPFIDANNLCNILYTVKKHIKLSTFVYKQEFCIYDIYNQLVIFKTILFKSNEIFNKIMFDNIKINNTTLLTYPAPIYAMFYFSELYKPKNYNLEKTNKYNTYYTAILDYFKDSKKGKIRIHSSERIIRKAAFLKLKNIEDVLFLDYYSYKYNKKKSYNYPINLIYRSGQHVFNYLSSKCSTDKISFDIKRYDNIYIDDFRFTKTTIYAKYKKYNYIIANVYNNTSYEIVPYYSKTQNIKKLPHIYVFNKFMIFNILNIAFYMQNSEKYIYYLLSYYKKYNNKYSNLNSYIVNYMGSYKDINVSKKIYNTGKDINNYIPYTYEQMHNKLREFNHS